MGTVWQVAIEAVCLLEFLHGLPTALFGQVGIAIKPPGPTAALSPELDSAASEAWRESRKRGFVQCTSGSGSCLTTLPNSKLVAGHSALVERSAACFTFGWSSLGRAAVPLPSHFAEFALWYFVDPFPDLHKIK